MNPSQRYFARMVSLVATLFSLLAAALAYNLAFDWVSTLIFTVLAVPNFYFYQLGLRRELRIARGYRFLNECAQARALMAQQWLNP